MREVVGIVLGVLGLGAGVGFVLARILHTQKERWDLVTHGSPDVLWHFNQKTKKFIASDRIWDWSNPVPGGAQGLYDQWSSLVRPEDREAWGPKVERFLSGQEPILDFEARIAFPGREERWFRVRAQKGTGRRSQELAGILSDVTEMKTLGARLWTWAHVDPLTGLSSRHRLIEALEAQESSYCLLLVDVDHFSLVNAHYQHEGGDRALKWLAQTLLSLFRSEDLVVRWGSDEFVVLSGVNLPLAEILARRIHETLEAPVPLGSPPVRLSVSVGIVPGSGGGPGVAVLLQQAEQALQQAKAAGGHRTTVFTEMIGTQSARRTLLERTLTEALVNGGLRLAFQPQFRLSDGRLTGFEALARWTDSDLGVVPPSEFIPVAEDLGLIQQLGAWALTEACQFLAAQPADVRQSLTMAVNVSVLQLRDDGFVDSVEAIVRNAGLNPGSIELEITETVLVETFEATIAKLARLRRLGFRIALDDFGQGYSSLSYLKVLPLDTLKIDKAFLDDGTPDSLLGAMIQLGRLLNLQVVAEGIESNDQIDQLVEHGCHLVQGYFFSHPLELSEAQAFLHRHGTGHS